jgi:hypothetical protein
VSIREDGSNPSTVVSLSFLTLKVKNQSYIALDLIIKKVLEDPSTNEVNKFHENYY